MGSIKNWEFTLCVGVGIGSKREEKRKKRNPRARFMFTKFFAWWNGAVTGDEREDANYRKCKLVAIDPALWSVRQDKKVHNRTPKAGIKRTMHLSIVWIV